MKYFIALIASAGIIFFWAVLSVGVGWDRGGGIIGMLFMWAIIAGVWGVIMAMPKSTSESNTEVGIRKPSAPTRTTNSMTHSLTRHTSALPAIDDSAFYASAMKECEGDGEARQVSTWARAYSMMEGDEKRTKAKYIELRVAELLAQEQKRQEDQHVESLQREMNDKQRDFANRYPIGAHYPRLFMQYGNRITRLPTETDAVYAARLQRFAKDYKRETGISLE